MSKELYIAEVERRMSELGEDYDTAGERAMDSYAERLRDQADAMRKRAKEEGDPHVAEPFRSILNGIAGKP